MEENLTWGHTEIKMIIQGYFGRGNASTPTVTAFFTTGKSLKQVVEGFRPYFDEDALVELETGDTDVYRCSELTELLLKRLEKNSQYLCIEPVTKCSVLSNLSFVQYCSNQKDNVFSFTSEGRQDDLYEIAFGLTNYPVSNETWSWYRSIHKRALYDCF